MSEQEREEAEQSPELRQMDECIRDLKEALSAAQSDYNIAFDIEDRPDYLYYRGMLVGLRQSILRIGQLRAFKLGQIMADIKWAKRGD